MLARGLIVSQLVELALYAALWWFGLGGAAAWTVAGAAVATWLLARWLFIGLTFFIAWRYRSEAPPEGRVGVIGALALWLRETAATALLYGWLQPMERLLRPALAVARDGETSVENTALDERERVAVLLLHGFFCNGGFFWWLRRALARAGIDNVYTLNMEPPFGSITGFSRQASARIEAIRTATGCRRVIVVAHSMGGLVARRMRELNLSQDAMAGLITLGTPHHGTWHARILASVVTRQMRLSLPVEKETPSNPWLDRLNADEFEPLPYPVTSVYSYQDNIVAPQDSAVLGMAENVPLRGVGHLELAFSKRVVDAVVARVLEWRAVNTGQPDSALAAN